MEVDRKLAEAYLRALGDGDGGEHPSLESWQAYVTGELPEEDAVRLADHAISCKRCAEIMKAVLVLKADGSRLMKPQSRIRLAMVAAFLVCALGLGFLGYMLGVTGRSRDGFRGPAQSRPVPVSPIGELREFPVLFEWKPAPGARGYRVVLMTSRGSLLWESKEVPCCSVECPPNIIHRPGSWLWVVIAVGEDGEERSSDTANFSMPLD